MSYCCQMREKFLIGIVAENLTLPIPIDAADCIDWDADGGIRPETGKPRPVIRIRFCPFCGKPVAGPMRTIPTEGA